VIWNQVDSCHFMFADAAEHNLRTGFEEMKLHLPDSSHIVDQFIVRFLKQSDGSDKLVPERCVRLKNGFLSTEREADDWDQRNDVARERYVQDFLKNSGVTINKSDTKRHLPNAPCECGSGKKYKKCCAMKKKPRTGVDEINRSDSSSSSSSSPSSSLSSSSLTSSSSSLSSSSGSATLEDTEDNDTEEPTEEAEV